MILDMIQMSYTCYVDSVVVIFEVNRLIYRTIDLDRSRNKVVHR